jgi:hypothetical protein
VAALMQPRMSKAIRIPRCAVGLVPNEKVGWVMNLEPSPQLTSATRSSRKAPTNSSLELRLELVMMEALPTVNHP